MGDALQQLVHLQCFNPQRAVEAIPARAEELRKYIKMNRFNPQRAVEAIPAQQSRSFRNRNRSVSIPNGL